MTNNKRVCFDHKSTLDKFIFKSETAVKIPAFQTNNPKLIMTMSLRLCYVIFLITIWVSSNNVGAQKTLLCDYNSWAFGRSGDGRFTVDDIDPNLCTHLSYYTVYLNIETSNVISDLHFLNDSEKLIQLKTRNPHLKVLIDVNVKQNEPFNFHVELMTISSHVDAIVKNVLDFIQQHNFDGLFLHFFSTENQKDGFTVLISAIKKAFQPYSYLLVVFGQINQNPISEEYEISSLIRDVDFLVLPAYDFHDPLKERIQTDHHSPLYSPSWDKENKTVDFAVNHWINKGFPAKKILLSISLHGKSWTLSSNETTPPAPAFGPSPPEKYSKQSGSMYYYEICQAIIDQGWQVFQDPNKRIGPYAVSPTGQNRTWVGYDDPVMAVIKSKYILSKGLGGAAVWDVSKDDFRNNCGDGHNPMLRAIYHNLFLQQTSLQNSSPIFKVNNINNVFLTGGIPFAIAFSILIFFVVSMLVILIKCWIDRII